MKRNKHGTATVQVHGWITIDHKRRLDILRTLGEGASVGIVIQEAVDLLWEKKRGRIEELFKEAQN